jgi:hypothetical protein
MTLDCFEHLMLETWIFIIGFLGRVLSRPEAQKMWILFFGSVPFDFYIERYICTVAFGRIAQI